MKHLFFLMAVMLAFVCCQDPTAGALPLGVHCGEGNGIQETFVVNNTKCYVEVYDTLNNSLYWLSPGEVNVDMGYVAVQVHGVVFDPVLAGCGKRAVISISE